MDESLIKEDRAVVILIRGIPGSGKSYLTPALSQALGQDNAITLDPDATDYQSQAYANHVKALTAEGIDSALHAYRFLRGQAYDGIANHKIVIWNQPFSNLEIFNKMVGRFKDYAEQHKTELVILVVEVEIDKDLAAQRVATRKAAGGHGPSGNTFARFLSDHKSFASEGYNTVTVDGNQKVEDSVEKIIEALKKLLADKE